MRGSAIHSVRSQWQTQWDRPTFAPLHLPNLWSNLGAFLNKSAQRVDVQNLIKIDSSVAALLMREKNGFGRGFFVNLIKSIYKR